MNQKDRERKAIEKSIVSITRSSLVRYDSYRMRGTLAAVAVPSHERIQNGFPDAGGLHSALRASKPTFLGRLLPVRRPAFWRLALIDENFNPDSFPKFDPKIATKSNRRPGEIGSHRSAHAYNAFSNVLDARRLSRLRGASL